MPGTVITQFDLSTSLVQHDVADPHWRRRGRRARTRHLRHGRSCTRRIDLFSPPAPRLRGASSSPDAWLGAWPRWRSRRAFQTASLTLVRLNLSATPARPLN